MTHSFPTRRSSDLLHTVYTHGFGVIAAFGNQRDLENEAQSTRDEPVWLEQGLPPTGELSKMSEGGYRGQIYFGEKSPDYSIVGKADADARDVELDIQDDSETGRARTKTYYGAAGVPVGDRTGVGEGKRGAVRVEVGGGRRDKKQNNT